MPRRFLSGLALQFAQDDGQSILLRQSAQFLVQDRQPVVLAPLTLTFGTRHRLLLYSPTGGGSLCLQGGTTSYTMQPIAQHRPRPERAGFADENEEGGLEGGLGVGVISQDAAANAVYHRRVPTYQGRECRFVPLAKKLPEQLAVG